MFDDPVVAEIHRIREEYAAQFNFDVYKIGEDLMARQGKDGRTVVYRSDQAQSEQIEQTKAPVASIIEAARR